MSGGSDDRKISANAIDHRFPESTNQSAGLNHFTEYLPGKSEAINYVPGPVLGDRREELGGRGIGALHRNAPCKPI